MGEFFIQCNCRGTATIVLKFVKKTIKSLSDKSHNFELESRKKLIDEIRISIYLSTLEWYKLVWQAKNIPLKKIQF